jgi:hypothetical protein
VRALEREDQLNLPLVDAPEVVVPVRDLDAAAVRALAYARSIATRLTVLQVPGGEEPALVRRRLRRMGLVGHIEFVELAAGVDPVEQILGSLEEIGEGRPVAVILPTVVPDRAWLMPLHLGGRLRRRLHARSGTAVVEVPYRV